MTTPEYSAPSRRPQHIPIPDRVEAGVRLLDERVPGWWERINLDEFQFDSTCDCVLGQLCDKAPQSYGQSNPYMAMADRLGISPHADDPWSAAEFGFDGSTVSEDVDLLADAWCNRIEARRATKAEA